MKHFTKRELNQIVTVTCYGKTEPMTREKAIDEFYTGMMCCEGSEGERYKSIYCQLMNGDTNVSDEY